MLSCSHNEPNCAELTMTLDGKCLAGVPAMWSSACLNESAKRPGLVGCQRVLSLALRRLVVLEVTIDGYASLAVGLVGNEGTLGICLMLGVDASRLRALVEAATLRSPFARGAVTRLPMFTCQAMDCDEAGFWRRDAVASRSRR